MRAMGLSPRSPSFEASRLGVAAGICEGRRFGGSRDKGDQRATTFAIFDEFWDINLLGASIAAVVATLVTGRCRSAQERVRARMPADSTGRIATVHAPTR